jgi:hypothetical protein
MLRNDSLPHSGVAVNLGIQADAIASIARTVILYVFGVIPSLDLVCTYLQLSVSIKSGKAFWRS